MKTFIRKTKEVQFGNSLSHIIIRSLNPNALISVKRIIYLFIFTAAAALLSSCEVGWVATEPSYEFEIERPVSPGVGYVWIDGGWRWDHDTHNYIREPGYWARQRHNSTYSKGYWKSGPRGKSWVQGHWRRGNEKDDDRR